MTSDNSYVNNKIKAFNSKLKKIAKLFKHVTILELNFNINCFTQHDLHLNGYVKGLLVKQITSLIYKWSCKKTEEPITLEWKMGLNDKATTHLANKEIVIPTTVTCRTSTRTKRPPITRQNDFLW